MGNRSQIREKHFSNQFALYECDFIDLFKEIEIVLQLGEQFKMASNEMIVISWDI